MLYQKLIRFYYHLKTLCILDATKRREYRSTIRQDVCKMLVKNIRWGVSYSLFDGEELLEASLRSIRSQVDYINVVYQDISWYGTKTTADLKSLLLQLKNEGLIDEIIYFEPNLKLGSHTNERAKRNLGLLHAKKAGCSYFMTMDVDEFYDAKLLSISQEFIIRKNLTHTFVPIVLYTDKATERYVAYDYFLVPFFASISHYNPKLGENKYTPAQVDPTRALRHHCFSKYYVIPFCPMHHMSQIRRDIDKKIDNSSAKYSHKNEFFIQLDEVNNAQKVTVENIFKVPTF